MSRGRSLASQIGRISPTDQMVATQWKGLVVLRAMPGGARPNFFVMPPPTLAQQEIRSAISTLSKLWWTLTSEQRSLWETYAQKLGRASDQAKADVSRGSGNIIPQPSKVQAGVHAFVGSNMLRVRSGLAFPILNPPMQDGKPPSPLSVAITYNNLTGVATVTFDKPAGAVAGFKYRLWGKVVSGIHTQLIATADDSPITFSSLRGPGGNTFNLIDMISANLIVQMDTITNFADRGSRQSAPSNVDNVIL